jgi:predicted Zn-dependent protease
MTPEQRLEAFRNFVAQRPDDPFARYSLAMALRAVARGEEAAAEFQELARRAPDYIPTYIPLGQVLEALGHDAEAVRVYEEGITRAAGKNDGHAQAELAKALEAVRARGASR